MANKHLRIGGSTADRTIACPAWLERSKNLPKQPGNVFADEGNLLHDAMEAYYQHGKDFYTLVGRLNFNEQILNDEHVKTLLEPARDCVEEVFNRFQIEEYQCEPFVEIIPDEAGGSIDLIAASADRKTVLILDYKFGGVRVDVKDNKQLQFYALAAKTDKKTADFFFHAERVAYAIVQPKVAYIPAVWVSDIDHLNNFKAELFEALDNPTRASVGDHCKYCPVYKTCPDRNAEKTKSYAEILNKIS